MQSIREPEVYDPDGGPLAVDGVSVGMTHDEVVQATGHRPQTSGFGYRLPGYAVDTWVTFAIPPKPEGSLEDATVFSIAGNVLTQDGSSWTIIR
jgi:hypothetical protein